MSGENSHLTLDEIACSEGTDRASNGLHDYMRTYDELFSPIREKPVTLLEIGVLGGAGLRTWARYFAHTLSTIYGMDPHPEFVDKPFTDSRIRLFNCSQADLVMVTELVGDTRFDIIIDDGGHFSSAQQKCFWHLWRNVNPGGFYCIEDLHSYAAPELCDCRTNIMEFLTAFAEDMQGQGAKAVGRVLPSDDWPDLDWILFRKGLAILRKAK